VAGGVIYFGDDKGRLTALDTEDGSVLCKLDTPGRISPRPAVGEKHVYFSSPQGVLAADRDTGVLLWQRNFAAGTDEGHSIPIGGRLYISPYDGYAYALDKETGAVVWKTDITRVIWSNLSDVDPMRRGVLSAVGRPRGVASDGHMFFQCVFDLNLSRIVALDLATGKKRWSFQSRGWFGLAADSVFIGSQDKHLYCLNKDRGEVVWKFKTNSRIWSRAAVFKESVIVPSCDGWLYRVRFKSGTLVWKFQTMPAQKRRTSIHSFPLVTDELVYFAAAEGQIYAVNVNTGTLTWKMRPSEHSELYSDLSYEGNRLFVVTSQDSNNNGENAIIALGP